MERERILSILRKRRSVARDSVQNAKYDQTRKRNEGRVHAYGLAINLLMTNERRNNEQR